MVTESTVVFTLRTDADTYALLKAAAERAHCTERKLLERMIAQHGLTNGVGLTARPSVKSKP
jgi:hypothetical protein